METSEDISRAWDALPEGARLALEEQWRGLAAGGLPCGAAIVDAEGVVAAGRNHAYDQEGPLESRLRYPLQHNRLAHAELNALALIDTDIDHAALTLWTTQHPCAMCAAAIAFTGIGRVRFIADDPSDHELPERIAASRQGVPYQPTGDPLWWTVSNLLFLYNSAALSGEGASNLGSNRERYAALVELTLELVAVDALGPAARAGTALPVALAPHLPALQVVASTIPAVASEA
jgi:tRNA(Arg) A34 adenosine deaminase TadA